jgi:hypothetical protein
MNKFGFFRNTLSNGQIVAPWNPNITVNNISTFDMPNANVAYGVNFSISSNITDTSKRIFFDVVGANANEMLFGSVTGNVAFSASGNANVNVFIKPSSNITSNTNIVINLRAGSADAEPFYTQNAIIQNHTNIVATGGTITTLTNGDKLHEFTSNSTFSQTAGNAFVQYLIVAGGGGGGGRAFGGGAFVNGGGGGGGGVFQSNVNNYFVNAYYNSGISQYIRDTTIPGSYAVVVGSGGIREANADTGVNYSAPTSGSNSSIFGITTTGGGYGGPCGTGAPSTVRPGGDGGSGGGGGRTANGTTNIVLSTDGQTQSISLGGGSFLVTQGRNGGRTRSNGSNNAYGGGGGGFQSSGGDGSSSGASGGDGFQSYITDTGVYYGGGGGGSSNGVTPGNNGLGGGTSSYGGGGRAYVNIGSNGGPGVVYVRYGPYGKKLVLT